jgi:hypothetical protein
MPLENMIALAFWLVVGLAACVTVKLRGRRAAPDKPTFKRGRYDVV